MGLDVFVDWCRTDLGLTVPMDPSSRFHDDLGLDAVEHFRFAVRFATMLEGSATVDLDMFAALDTPRDLYLYMLTVLSMPMRNQ